MSTIVGVDVSKETLEIGNFIKLSSCSNDDKGISKFIKELKKAKVSLVVFEPTGGYESRLKNALNEAKIPIAMVNAKNVRSFADSMDLAKTDKIDAKIIARFAEVRGVQPQALPDPYQKEASALITRRRQIIDMRTAEKNRLENATEDITKNIINHINYLQKELDVIDSQLENYLKSNDKLNHKAVILQSTPGVGPVLTMTILTSLPEIGTLNDKQIAKLVGLAPMNKDSGKMQKKRTTIGGRTDVKSVLYMATMNASKHNSVIRDFYQRLIKSGKLKMVALVACMRKLIIILNAMVKNNTMWEENFYKKV